MKTTNDTTRKQGSALFTVLLVVTAATALLAITVGASVQRIYSTGKLADRIRAISIAEAGAHRAYSILTTNFAARTSDAEFPLTAYADGNYDVTVTPVSSNLAVISSLGTYKTATEQVILDIKNYGGTPATIINMTLANYAILCGGEFKFRGCGDITSAGGSARLHANGNVSISGNAQTGINVTSSTKISINNNQTINGSVTAPVLSYTPSHVTITGSATATAVPMVTVPDIDLTPYYNRALANGQVYNGDQTLSADFTPPGGIMWVNGRLTLAGNCTYTGSFIATGDISVPGTGAINNSNPYPTLATRDGSIQFTGQKSVEGLIYVKTGNYTQTGGNTHNGQLVVKGNIDKGGNSDILVYNQTVLTPPGGTPQGPDVIALSAWQK